MTDELIDIANCRAELYKLTKKHPMNTDISKKYKKFRNDTSAMIRERKEKFCNMKINECTNPKSTWKFIKQEMDFSGKNQIKYPNEVINQTNNKLCTGQQNIADEFNHYFASVGVNLASNNKNPLINNVQNLKHIYLDEVSKIEVYRYLSSASENKSTVPDNISPSCIKEFLR